MIKVEHLSKHYGQAKAVNDISFEVAEGQNLVLLGTSGCGKTTTLKMLNRLIEPTQGQIQINGEDITNKPPELLRRQIGYVLQNTGLFPHYTIAENIAVVANLLKWDKQRIQTRTQELIQKLNLPQDVLQKYPHQLSGGQQQRVGLARALIADAPVLLMDEPFGALDNITRAKIQADFKTLDELQRKTIVMVTHDVQEAFELGDQIAIMDQGRIVQQGTPAGLLFKPANRFVSDFLQSQRLQLELRLVNLDAIAAALPANMVEAQQTASLTGDSSVWQAMEVLKDASYPVNVKLADGTLKAISFTGLMSAYESYQNQVKA
ncbi:ABC transporter ATP-binding protein [Mucilaginibacter sp. CSA2-8R]|uniref:ABC transporter ATP-binding protein n=1 Tax=Mucilaginibacter sp. CSA2-8R TaxID=3141542 RepID=UPI00315D63B5